MSHHCSVADERNTELLKQIRWQRPPPWWKRRILLTILLIFQVTLLLVIFPWLFVYFENQTDPPQIGSRFEADLLNKTPVRPTYLDGLFWSLYTPLTLGLDETWPQTRPGQILVRASDITKVLMIGTGAALFHHALTHRHIQKGSVVWYIRRPRRPVSTEGEEERYEWVMTVNGQCLIFHGKTPCEITQKLVELLIKLDKDQQKPESG